jgi:sugar/nucleoside kinase (ribokinase family)
MDVIGIGLANIDLVAHVKDEFLAKHKLPKGRCERTRLSLLCAAARGTAAI